MLTVKVAIVRLECVLPHFSVQEWLVVTATARCAGLGQTVSLGRKSLEMGWYGAFRP